MLFLVISLVICGAIASPVIIEDGSQKIIGGYNAYAGQFPYQASLRYNNNGAHFCGGSIISEEWILTAANCISGQQPSNVKVVVGSIYLNLGGVSHGVLILIPHPEYNPSRYLNDIGLIRLNGRIQITNNVRPTGLSNDPSSLGVPLTVSGWGITSSSSSGNSQPNTMQWLTIQTITNTDCQNRLPIMQLFDTHICSEGRTGLGICHGDHGNPLVFNNQQHGIASVQFACGLGLPDVYTKVSIYRSWIRDVANV